MMNTGIFGTPPEPIFNSVCHGMPADVLEEWLNVLAELNNIAMLNIPRCEGHFKNGKNAEFLFLLAEKLKLPPEAKYMALELFDKFMTRHVKELYDHVLRLTTPNKRRDWDAICDRVQNQVFLRMVTCCQLASKLTSHYKVVSPRQAQSTLKYLGHKYNADSILQSELRILKTLNFKVMVVSPLLYVETLFEILGYNCKGIEVKVYHGVSMLLLDFIYIQWRHLYEELLLVVARRTNVSPITREKFAPVERDMMLLAVAVIASSSYLVDHKQTDKVIENLSDITRIQSDDILDFSSVLIRRVTELGESYGF